MSYTRRYETGRVYNNPYHGDFSITNRGVNDQGNRWDNRSYGESAANQNPYHYSNKDGSYYYKSPDNSEYFNNGRGQGRYTNAEGRSTYYDYGSRDQDERLAGPSTGTSDGNGGADIARGGAGIDEDDHRSAYSYERQSNADELDHPREQYWEREQY